MITDFSTRRKFNKDTVNAHCTENSTISCSTVADNCNKKMRKLDHDSELTDDDLGGDDLHTYLKIDEEIFYYKYLQSCLD